MEFLSDPEMDLKPRFQMAHPLKHMDRADCGRGRRQFGVCSSHRDRPRMHACTAATPRGGKAILASALHINPCKQEEIQLFSTLRLTLSAALPVIMERSAPLCLLPSCFSVSPILPLGLKRQLQLLQGLSNRYTNQQQLKTTLPGPG